MLRVEPIDWAIFLITVVVVLLVASTPFLSAWRCSREWADSGMQSRWSFGAGCQVQRKDGTWVPARMLRDLEH